MATTITLKNVPDDVYARLKRSAQTHRRSVNGEAIACLERVLAPTRAAVDERLDRAREIRTRLGPVRFEADEIARAVRRGRE